jgi:hypothetical protein
LVSVVCEVESEKKLRRRPPWQQPIYSDDIHRILRYIAGAAPRGVMDVFCTAVIERPAGGSTSLGAHGFLARDPL